MRLNKPVRYNLMLPTSLYIHVPWCIRKCPYCDFNSHALPPSLDESYYIKALIDDFSQDLNCFEPREIATLFIGGGTPSLFSPASYEQLFTALQARVSFAKDIEITLEANPGTVEQERFKGYREIGINRLSLGIQSFNAAHLKALGRIHDDEQAHKAIDAARKAGFANINLDLMYALPDQSIEQGILDLKTAISYEPQHLSWYQLTIEPNTVFYKKPPLLPREEDAYQLEKQGLALLEATGFKRYEVSAYARNEQQAKHNLNYWLFGDYYGIGAGACGKITLAAGTVYRTKKCRQPKDYLQQNKSFLAEKQVVDAPSLLFEFMLNTTRLQQPIAHSLFYERTGLSFELLKPLLEKAAQKELIFLNESFWQVTAQGRRFTNDLQALFLPSI